MRRFIQQTWLPSAVFVGLCTAEAVHEYRQCGRPWTIVGIAATGLALVPPIWWWVVARAKGQRSARGAAAGALCVILSLNFEPIFERLWWEHTHPAKIGQDFGRLEVAILLLLSISVGGPIGALVGALVAALQNRWWPLGTRGLATHAPSRERTVGDGALAGAAVGVLTGVVLCIYFLSLPGTEFDGSSVLMNLSVAWLIMVPSCAAIGATLVAVRKLLGILRPALRRLTDRTGSTFLNRELKWRSETGSSRPLDSRRSAP